MGQSKTKKIINLIIINIILFIILILLAQEYNEAKIKTTPILKNVEDSNQIIVTKINREENLTETTIQEKNFQEDEQKYPKEEVIKEYKGYDVIAKLKIPKIDLETYVLKNYSVQALNVSVTRYWGTNPNEIGNFCIAGHNFKRDNMFRNLKNLEVNDTFTLSDNKIGRVEYEIYDIYKVFPDDVSCLSQQTNEKEVTLITCTSDSKKRIILKAKEVKNNQE